MIYLVLLPATCEGVPNGPSTSPNFGPFKGEDFAKFYVRMTLQGTGTPEN